MSHARIPVSCHPSPCLFAAAIDAVTLPLRIRDAESVLFANAAAAGLADQPGIDGSEVPVEDVQGNKAIVQILAEVAPVPLVAGDADWRRGRPAEMGPRCLHEAAFEALPLPVVVHDERRFIACNACARLLIGGDPVGLPPGALTHADSADAGQQRRAVVLKSGLALRDVSVKMQGLHGRTIAVRVDAVPVDHLGARITVITTREVR